MIRMGAIVRIDVFYVHNLPGGFAGLQEDIIQTVTEEYAAPGPLDLVGGGWFVFVDLTESILPIRADVLDLMRMFGDIEIASDYGGTSR